MNKRQGLAIIIYLISTLSLVIHVDAKGIDESSLLLLGARNALRLGDYEKAAYRYRVILKRYPDLLEAVIEYGWLLMETGKTREVLDHFEAAMKRYPRHREIVNNYIRILLNLKDFKQAANEINTILKIEPKDKKAYLFLAELYISQMRYSDAQSIYSDLIKTGLAKEAKIGLADLNTAMKDYEEAYEILDELVKEFPDDPELHVRVAINLAQRQRMIEAYEELKMIKDPFLQGRVEAELSNIFGEYFRADVCFRELLRQRPMDYTLYIGLAESLLGQEDYDNAGDLLKSILKIYPQDLRTRLDIVDIFILQRRFKEAEKMIRGILKEYPQNIHAIYLLWRLQYLQNKEDHALLIFYKLAKTIKTLSEAKMLQVLMLKGRDYKGLEALSERFIAKGVYDQTFLENYFTALLKMGETKKGIDTITNLLEGSPDDPFLKASLSEFYLLNGDKEKAIELMSIPFVCMKQAEVYYKLKRYKSSVDIYLELLNSDPNNLLAIIGLVKGLSALGEYDKASQVLNTSLRSIPQELLTPVFLLLSWVCDGSKPYYELIDNILKERIKHDHKDIDLQIAYFNILIHQRRFTEAITGYMGLKGRLPNNPFITIRLARLLSLNKEYYETLRAYDDYLKTKPYDLNAWREKARFYGWRTEYENAISEYNSILQKYPEHKETMMEKEAKEALWRGRLRLACTYYKKLLEREPDNPEALLDMGQIFCNGLRPSDAEYFYRRLLYVVDPGHQQARLAMELSELSKRPQGVLGYGYVKTEGYDGKSLITYKPFIIRENFRISRSLLSEIEYQGIEFGLDEGSFNSNIAKLRSRYAPNHYLYFDSFVSILNYHKINRENLNFGVDLSYEWPPACHTKIGFERKDLWENSKTLLSNIYTDRYYAIFKTNISKEIDLELLGDYSLYSDDNTMLNSELLATYKIFPFPRLLRLILKLNSYGFHKEGVYFSPVGYTKWTAALDLWHFLGFPFRNEYLAEGKNNNLYSLYYGYSNDSDNNSFNEMTTRVSYNITRSLLLNGQAQFTRSSRYNEDNIFLYFGYYF